MGAGTLYAKLDFVNSLHSRELIRRSSMSKVSTALTLPSSQKFDMGRWNDIFCHSEVMRARQMLGWFINIIHIRPCAFLSLNAIIRWCGGTWFTDVRAKGRNREMEIDLVSNSKIDELSAACSIMEKFRWNYTAAGGKPHKSADEIIILNIDTSLLLLNYTLVRLRKWK